MRYAEKIAGLAFAGLTVLNLLRGDWLGSAVTGMASVSMLFGERLKLPPAAGAALGVVALALIVVTVSRALG